MGAKRKLDKGARLLLLSSAVAPTHTSLRGFDHLSPASLRAADKLSNGDSIGSNRASRRRKLIRRLIVRDGLYCRLCGEPLSLDCPAVGKSRRFYHRAYDGAKHDGPALACDDEVCRERAPTIDHRIPRAHRIYWERDDIESFHNFMLSHRECNRRKSNDVFYPDMLRPELRPEVGGEDFSVGATLSESYK